MKPCLKPQTQDKKALDVYRGNLSLAHTRTIDNHVYEINTGEYYGTYTFSTYSPEPIYYATAIDAKPGRNWFIQDDGSVSPLEIIDNSPQSPELATVMGLRPVKTPGQIKTIPTRGRRPQVIDNPLGPALYIVEFDGIPTPWLDDIVFGAIYTGPGVINGMHSVSLADVKRILRLSVISTAEAASCLFNHERQPMGIRQVQRVIEAARTALRGIALYLERHPDILRSIDVQVDFDMLWLPQQSSGVGVASKEHPMKQQALDMIEARIPNKTVAKALGVSKNTIKRWKEYLPSSHSGGVNQG